MDESISKQVNALFMVRWNTFHVPVHSPCFLMDKAFYHMDHYSAVKLELIQVIKILAQWKLSRNDINLDMLI